MKQQETKRSLPVGWTRVALEGLGNWAGGGTPSKGVPGYWTGGHIPWVSPKDMKTHRIRATQDYITEAAVRASATQLIPAGSVLMVTRSGILKHTFPVAITDIPVTVNQDLKALTPHRGINPEYVAYALNAFGDDVLNTCSKGGTTVQNIETPSLLRYEVPLAPAPEQPRIVSAIETQFTRLDVAVTTLERVQANLKRYRASVLKAAVEGRLVPTEAELARREGREYEPASVLLEKILKRRRLKWEEAELAKMKANGKLPKDDRWKAKYQDAAGPVASGLPEVPEGWQWSSVAMVSDAIQYGHTASATVRDAGPRFLRITDIQDGRVDWARVPSCDIDIGEIDKYRLRDGNLVFARTGATTGKSYLIDQCPEAVFASYLIRMSLNLEVSPRYVYLFFQSHDYWVQIEQGKRGIGQPNVNAEVLSRIVIPVPPRAEQDRIVREADSRLSVADGLAHDIRSNVRRADRLRQSVLKWAFEGRLVDQDPADEPASVLVDRIKAERENGGTERPARKPRGRPKKVTR